MRTVPEEVGFWAEFLLSGGEKLDPSLPLNVNVHFEKRSIIRIHFFSAG